MRTLTTLLAACLLSSCGGGSDAPPDSPPTPDANLGGPVVVDLAAPPPPMLSAYRLFTWDPTTGFAFNERVVPYDLNTPLFSDYSLKQRAIYLPPGTAADFDPEQAFELPVGSVVVKNFYFPADFRTPTANLQLIETRLMVRHADGWHPLPYIWDAAQRDAVLTPAGEVRAIRFIDEAGATQTASYLIPERNQCQSCHARQELGSPMEIVLIGLKARHLNRDYDYGGRVGKKNQIDQLTALGMLRGAPASATVPAAYDFRPIEADGIDKLPAAEIAAAARSYLDINCAHCHNPQAVQGQTSQLFLNHDNTDAFRLGECKRPGSAGTGNGGLVFDVVPGDPENSILYFRTQTTQVGAMMPLLGRSIRHRRGVELLHAWISGMPPRSCVTAAATP
ncbi:MAG: hypothetical protein H7138_06885 [Myxococcales bacterium]|nr:hypothetical protein [Myxococcales bacterium]